MTSDARNVVVEMNAETRDVQFVVIVSVDKNAKTRCIAVRKGSSLGS